MSLRGWDNEHSAYGLTTSGHRVQVVTGLTRDPRNPARKVGALAIGNGPTLVLRNAGDISNGPEIINNIRKTLAELLAADRQDEVPHRRTSRDGEASYVARRDTETNQIHWILVTPDQEQFITSLNICRCEHIPNVRLTTELEGGEPCEKCQTYYWQLPTTTEAGATAP